MTATNNNSRYRAAKTYQKIADVIAGQSEGDRFILDIGEFPAVPDALAVRIREIGLDQSRLTGFCRALQKYIERTAA